MARKTFTAAQVQKMILESDSGEESEASIADSVDSMEEDAFLRGEDATLDIPQRPESPPVSPPPIARQRQSTRAKRRKVSHPSSSGPEAKGGWHKVDTSDQEPQPFMFCPRRDPGVQLDLQQEYSPLDVFQLFFTKAVLATLCLHTNKYARHKHSQGSKQTWKNIDTGELLTYLGLTIYMGLVRFAHIKDMWSTDKLHRHPFPASVMSCNRFKAISSFLHMSDPEADVTNDRLKGSPGYDPLFRLRPLRDDIIMSCKAYYHPHQNITIDERMVASKGRHRMKQYMKDKPTKWGFKLFALADSQTGYTFDFSVYQGKQLAPSGKGLSFDSVVNLLPVSFLGTGYRLYVDNFYTSTALFTHLYSQNIAACGTIRENRIGFPKTKVNDLPKKATRGDIRWVREGPLLYVKWKDTREVTMCSSIHKAFSGNRVSRSVKAADGWRQQRVPVPDAVLDYNKYMGGVDLSGAFIKHCTVAKKTTKWYKKFFYHFVDIAVVNSFIIHAAIAREKKQRPLTQKRFREILCEQLSACGHTESVVPVQVPQPQKQMCVPVAITDTSAVDSRVKATQGRKYCVHCHSKKLSNKTIYKCLACNVPLCIVADRICFAEWHLQKNT
uniref:PiggyBac transposable element-derived protein 4-like n=1 Tax=Paramormyrops kingsleyae TaxID=1676925 RepID=A0A3B3SQ50_9TELE|nr:piggyBac transposable element-derived protein 4-like [Paramormyrops kingsleyae]